ncbi:hypothetical protein M422DRAFT_240181 [Sphaerobolus stellatus SS14]|nr:hypothetical protein M422DRAFT_240181 [Sphaerobolus stellatus SS14]
MRTPSPANNVFVLWLSWILSFIVFSQEAQAQASNVTIDNTSSLLNYSPEPCFNTPPPNCSPEWTIQDSSNSFNGSTTNTNGTAAASGLDILPRVSLTFQGDSILFVPGPNSNASATVVVDDLPSILLNTATDAFSGSGLNASQFHTISVTFVPNPNSEFFLLEVDYFIVGVNTPVSSSTTGESSTTLTPAPIPSPSSSSSPTLMSSSLPSSTSSTSSSPTGTSSESASNIVTSTRPPPGTIAAISLSAALVVVLAGMSWLFLLQRRRRRQRAIRREAEILEGTRMPSELYGRGEGISPVSPAQGQRYSAANVDALVGPNQRPPDDYKGKARMRESTSPPVHYTPWRQ